MFGDFLAVARWAVTRTKLILDAPSASAGGNVTTRGILPLQRGFFDGATALYITPEVGVPPGSSFTSLAQNVAEGFNSNFVPTAFASLPGSGAVDDIFVFTDGNQGNVLASAPHPAGPTNTDTNYSPLWQISLVSFNNGRTRRVLKSQAAIQEAATDGDVTITKTDIIVECSVIFTPGADCFRTPDSSGTIGIRNQTAITSKRRFAS